MQNDDLSTLFDLLPIGAYRSSPDGRQLRANPALARLDGYESEAEMLVATHDLAQEWYVDPLRRDQFKAELAQHGRVVDFVSEVYRHKSRERIWVRVHAHVVRDAAGAILYYEGTVQDVTQEQQTRMALQASERRFRAITEKAQLLTLIYGEDLRLSYVSPAALTLLGFEPSVKLGTAFLDWFHPDDVSEAAQEIERIKRFENSGAESVYRLRHADGNWRYFALLANNCLADEAVQGVVTTARDVTDAHLAQQHLIESEARFRSLTEMSADWYWEMDAELRFTRVEAGPRTNRTWRYDMAVGKLPGQLSPTSVTEAQWAEHFALLRSHLPFYNFEFQRELSDGQRPWHTISGEPVFDESGTFKGYRGVGRDVTDLKVAEEAIRQMAFHDPLTGLANRRLLMDRLQQTLTAADRKQKVSALLFLDLDRFKQLNDSLGHDAGDEMLLEVARRLRGCVRAVDTVARVGGDEFVLLLQDLGETVELAAEQSGKLGHKVLLALAAPYHLSKVQYQSGASIGAVVIGDNVQDAEAWLKKADTAMYQAKAAGRNALRFFAAEEPV